MENTNKSKIILVLALIIIIGAVGVYLLKHQDTKPQETTNNTPEQVIDTSFLKPGEKLYQKNGETYSGTALLTGYLEVKNQSCTPGSTCDRAIFRFSESTSDVISNFYKGSIEIGCYQKDKSRIYYENPADKVTQDPNDRGVEWKRGDITGQSLQKLLNSNRDNQVKLKLTQPVYTSGQGAPECYSQFRDFEIL